MPQSDIAPTPVERIPTAEEHLEAAFASHGYQQEAMTSEYLRVRREALAKIDEEIDDPDAEFDVRNFLSKDESRRKAAMQLANDAANPVVSRQTQMAILKQLVMDYFRGKKRPGLSALTALQATKMINEMSGYDKLPDQKITHEHKITTLPVIQQPFKGELAPLKVTDISAEDGSVVSIANGDGDGISPAVSPVEEDPDF